MVKHIIVSDWQPNTLYYKNSVFVHESNIYRATQNFLSPLLFSEDDYFSLASACDCFQPTDIEGLFAWHEDDQELYQEDSPVTPSGIGDLVGYWGDLSGNLNHLMQPVEAAKPIRQLTGIVFDGLDNYLSTDTVTGVSRPFTVFIVSQAAWTGTKLIIGDTSSPPAWYVNVPYGTFYEIRVNSGVSLNSEDSAFPDSLFYLSTAIFDGVDSSVARNGGEFTEGNTGINTSFSAYQLCKYGAAIYKEAIIKAILMYSAALTLPEIDQVRGYLNGKYNVY